MEKAPENLRIILGSGETYGHLNLAVALIEYLKQRIPRSKIVFVGAKGRVPMERVIPPDVETHILKIIPYDRRGARKNLTLPFYIAISLIQSLEIIKIHRPDVVVGLGAFPSGPLMYAAALKKIPAIIIEPNVYPGLTNRLVKKVVNKICISYSETSRYFPEDKLVLTGTPVRNAIINSTSDRNLACASFGLNPSHLTCFVTAGSSDPSTVNRTILNNISEFDRHNIQLLWQTGEQHFDYVCNALRNKKTDWCFVHPFIENIEKAYAAADLVVSAGGAVTLAELAVLGLPAIIIPSAYSTENHHYSNAFKFVQGKASVILDEHEVPEKLLRTIIDTIYNQQKLQQMSMSIRQLAAPQASELVFNEIVKSVSK